MLLTQKNKRFKNYKNQSYDTFLRYNRSNTYQIKKDSNKSIQYVLSWLQKRIRHVIFDNLNDKMSAC